MHAKRGISTRILPAVLGLSVALLVAAAPNTTAKPPRLGVIVPEPGHVSLAVASAELNTAKPGKLPQKVRLGFPKAADLPPSVRVVWATRVLRERRSVTYAIVIVIVNQAQPSKAPAKRQPDFVDLIYDMFVTDAGECTQCREHFEGKDLDSYLLCRDCSKVIQRGFMDLHVDDGTKKPTRKALADLFTGVQGDDAEDPVFDDGRRREPSLETGHYDDGHAFGWGVKSKRDERELLTATAEAMLRQDAGIDFFVGLEDVAGVDLNGDQSSGAGGVGTFARHPQCEAVADPPNCTYLAASVSFATSFSAFQIEIPGYRVQPGELTGAYEGSTEIGSCTPFEPTVVHCNLSAPVPAGTVVTTQVEPATQSQPEGVRLPDGSGGQLFLASPSPNVERLGGPFSITGP